MTTQIGSKIHSNSFDVDSLFFPRDIKYPGITFPNIGGYPIGFTRNEVLKTFNYLSSMTEIDATLSFQWYAFYVGLDKSASAEAAMRHPPPPEWEILRAYFVYTRTDHFVLTQESTPSDKGRSNNTFMNVNYCGTPISISETAESLGSVSVKLLTCLHRHLPEQEQIFYEDYLSYPADTYSQLQIDTFINSAEPYIKVDNMYYPPFYFNVTYKMKDANWGVYPYPNWGITDSDALSWFPNGGIAEYNNYPSFTMEYGCTGPKTKILNFADIQYLGGLECDNAITTPGGNLYCMKYVKLANSFATFIGYNNLLYKPCLYPPMTYGVMDNIVNEYSQTENINIAVTIT